MRRLPRGACLLVAALVVLPPLAEAYGLVREVEVRNDRFEPESVYMILGDVLRITNADHVTRRFVTEPEAWRSDAVGPKGQVEWRPDEAGDYLVRDLLQPEVFLQVHVEPYRASSATSTARVEITTPSPDSVVRGLVEVRGTATNPAGNLTGLRIRVEGTSDWTNLPVNASWRFTLDTTRFPDGARLIEIQARDDTTWSAPASLRLRFENGPDEPPALTMVAPLPNATFEPRVAGAWGNATDPEGDPVTVEWRLDYANPWNPARVHPNGTWSATLDLRDVPAGRHHLEIRATAGNLTTALNQLLYVERPPPSLPSVRVLQWDPGAPVQGLVTVAVQATGGAGIPYRSAEWRLPGGGWQPMRPVGASGDLFEAEWDAGNQTPGAVKVAFRVHDGVEWSSPHVHPFVVQAPDAGRVLSSAKYPTVDGLDRNQTPMRLPEAETPGVPAVLVFALLALAALAVRQR